jgi:hypothetical protein
MRRTPKDRSRAAGQRRYRPAIEALDGRIKGRFSGLSTEVQ